RAEELAVHALVERRALRQRFEPGAELLHARLAARDRLGRVVRQLVVRGVASRVRGPNGTFVVTPEVELFGQRLELGGGGHRRLRAVRAFGCGARGPRRRRERRGRGDGDGRQHRGRERGDRGRAARGAGGTASV